MYYIVLTSAFPAEAPNATPLSVPNSGSRCAECGTIKKSSKRSCCASGGSWFANCGDAGDTKFDHTWVEGIQACKGFVTSVSGELPLQVMIDTPQPQNIIKQHKNIYRVGNLSNDVAADSEHCVGLARVAIYMCFLFVISQI